MIFSNEFAEEELKRAEEKKDFDYRKYLAYNTPWFEQENILCIVDLPNINFLATGSYDKKIRLWDLRTSTKVDKVEDKAGAKSDGMKVETSNKAVFKTKDKSTKSKTSKSKKGKKEENTGDTSKNLDYILVTKEPSKELIGHEKGVREIAYSEKHKILVS